jgi:Flp pilus assembly protein protease CpaA
VKDMTFVPTLAIFSQLTDKEHRQISNPVSLFELSCQVRLIWLVETAVAVRLLGAAGTVTAACVVALAVFE